jgi:putative transposase
LTGHRSINPFSEALFRTCKYRPDWPTSGFASKDDAQRWVASFVGWYNTEHRHSAIRFVTPNARHTGQERDLLDRRTQLYTAARAANPARWSRQIRNWSPVREVCLNPERDTSDREIRDAT